MEKQKPEKKQSGKVNYIWVLAGGYLLYLAFKLLVNIPDAPNLLVNIGGGGVFLAVGGWLLWHEWRAYQYGLAHKDDPETWSDELEESEEEGEAP